MMMSRKFSLFLISLIYSSLLFSGTMGAAKKPMIFLGLGGSYSTVKVDQNLNNFSGAVEVNAPKLNTDSSISFSNYPYSVVSAFAPLHLTQSTFAPEARIGYLNFFNHSDWLWGAKFSYEYLSITACSETALSLQHLDISPQNGYISQTDSSGNTITSGQAIPQVNGFQTEVRHNLDLIPFLGHTLPKGYTYLGVGPSLFNSHNQVSGVSISATDQSLYSTATSKQFLSLPIANNFSNSKWIWGIVAQIGLSYFIDDSWFFDLNYRYALTPETSYRYSSSYTLNTPQIFTTKFETFNSSTTTNSSFTLNNSQYLTVQELAISINKAFDF
jgi:opacity protein-like surface antigen